MPFDRFLIAPINTGLQTNLRPFLIMDDAFESLQNAYVFRGRVRKRFGSLLIDPGQNQLNSRLRILIGTTDGAGNITATVPGSIFAVGQMFSIATEIFTVIVTGAPGVMNDTGASTVHTFNTTTGQVVINGAAALTAVFWYPSEPVMGLTQFEINAINNHPSYAFDTQFAYVFSGGAWARSFTTNGLPLDIPVFHDPSGNKINYFWSSNWTGVADSNVTLYTTNFQIANPFGLGLVTDDPIWTLTNAGGSGGTNTWAPFSYSPDANINYENVQPLTVTRTVGPSAANEKIIASYVQQARIILPFKNRLVLLNTIENNANGAIAYDPTNHGTRIASGITPATYLTSTNSQFVNRCRYSFNGSPFATNAWLEPNQTYNPGSTGQVVAAGGGFIDAATDEAIVSAEFIKDRLIVYFERSTWELVYTGNEILPFIWQKLNTELGSQGTFSTVPFDTQVMTIGNTGVHACNGSNVARTDQKIPQLIFNDFATKDNSPFRIQGIRDYFTELVYWAFVNTQSKNQKFPNQILVYNYQNDSWALNDDCFTAFGYFEQQTDLIWANAVMQWQEFTGSWIDSLVQANQRQIIAGTPDGFVLRILPDISRNGACMQITNMTIPSATFGAGYVDILSINHNVAVDDFIAIENTVGITTPIGGFYQVTRVTDANNFIIYAPDIVGTYLGAGTFARVSNIQFTTKQFNPYVTKDRNVYLHKVDFGVEKTQNGQIFVDYYPSATSLSMLTAGASTNSLMGTGILETSPYNASLYPLEQEQERLWHPLYFQSEGECIQLAFYMDDAQLSTRAIAWSDFQLDGMILYTQPISTRLQ